MSDNRRGAVNLSTILMVIAILVVGGFFYWLWDQAQIEAARQAEVAAAAREAEEDEPDISEAVIVDVVALGRDMEGFAGQLVQIEGVTHGGNFARQGFYAGTQTPFLISAPALVADTVNPVAERGALTLVGTVAEGGTAVFESWLAAGTINESDMMMADFVNYYLDLFAIVEADGTVVEIATAEEGDDEDEENDSVSRN